MNAREHVIIGSISATAAILAARSLNLTIIGDQEMIIGITIAGLSSLIPDIDEPNSTISRASFWMMALGLLLIFAQPIAGLTQNIAPGTMNWLLLIQGSSATSIQMIIGYLLLGFAFIAVLNGRLLNHRGLTHTLLCWFILSGAMFATYNAIESPRALLFTACFSLGYLLHLVADATTEEGLPDLLFPLNGDNSIDIQDWIDNLIWEIQSWFENLALEIRFWFK